ncbi:MAG: hypothetical protein IJR65_08285 [Oscillospiraceae bacterium]|nr:hypothetical protein [Oscillospiraceae bacterium]
MIKPNDFVNAVETVLQTTFPDEPVYRDYVPEDFIRPSNEIECAAFSAEQVGGGSLDLTVKLIVRTFVPVDGYHHSDFDALYLRAMRVLALFSGGYIYVSDPDTGVRRAPYIHKPACPVTGRDFAEIHIEFALQVFASDYGPSATQLPTMQRVAFSGTINKEIPKRDAEAGGTGSPPADDTITEEVVNT